MKAGVDYPLCNFDPHIPNPVRLRMHPQGHMIPDTAGIWTFQEDGRDPKEVLVYGNIINGFLTYEPATGRHDSVRIFPPGKWEWVRHLSKEDPIPSPPDEYRWYAQVVRFLDEQLPTSSDWKETVRLYSGITEAFLCEIVQVAMKHGVLQRAKGIVPTSDDFTPEERPARPFNAYPEGNGK